jgi:hypothetical protein
VILFSEVLKFSKKLKNKFVKDIYIYIYIQRKITKKENQISFSAQEDLSFFLPFEFCMWLLKDLNMLGNT